MPFSPDNLFLLVILIFFARVCFCDLKYGVYIITFLMPTYLWRTEFFSIPTTLLELMIYILFLVWLASKINFSYFSKILTTPSPSLSKEGIRKLFQVSSFKFQVPILSVGIILLFLGLAISTALSDNFRVSIGIFKGWFVDPFLFFLVLINVIKTKKQIAYLFGAWALSGLVVAIISLFYLIAGELTYDGRLKAFFLSPNHLAMYLAPAFLIALKTYNSKLKTKNSFYKCVSSFKFQVSSLVIIFISLYFTFSYGAFLGIAVAILYLIIPLLRGGWGCVKLTKKPTPSPSQKGNNPPLALPQRGIIKIILCLIILSSLLFLSVDKLQQITDSQNRSSFHSRLMIWNASKEILKDNFVFGIGPGTFQEVYLNYSNRFGEPYLEWAVPQPHNIFLAFWLQTGIIGLLGFILILIWFFSNALKYKNAIHNPEYSGFTIPIILMIYFLTHGLIDTTYWKNDLSLMFWILIGTMVVYRNIQKSRE